MLLVSGCETRGFDLAIKNATPSMITDARVRFDGFDFVYGAAGPGIDKTYGGLQRKVPREIDVEWRDAAGNLLRDRVPVTVGEEFSGIITLELHGDGQVYVTSVPFDKNEPMIEPVARPR